MLPPPIRPASLMVWCGARNGRVATSERPSMRPTTLCTRVASSASSSVSGGRIVGRRLASIVFPAPGGPTMITLWPPAAATSSARLTCVLALHVAEVDVVVRLGAKDGLADRPAAGAMLPLAAQELERLGQRRDRNDVDALDHRRLARIVGRQQEAAQPAARAPPAAIGSAPRTDFDPAVERQLAEDRVARASWSRRQLAGGGEHAERDRQVERRAVLLHVGRREVDVTRRARNLVAAVLAAPSARGPCSPCTAPSGSPTIAKLRQAVAEVDLDLDQQAVDACRVLDSTVASIDASRRRHVLAQRE